MIISSNIYITIEERKTSFLNLIEMATKSNSNKKRLHPLVVSTDCSTLRSFCHSKFSHDLPTNLISIRTPHHNHFRDGKADAQEYRRKTHQLELEIKQLDRLIDVEKSLRHCIEDITVTHSAKLQMKLTNKDHKRADELFRLANGGYVYRIEVIDKPWGRLAIQASAPAILSTEAGSKFSQVLQRMAKMGTRNLNRWLLESMPMGEIHHNQIEENEMGTVHPGFEKGFMEAIVSVSMEKMGILALEGLRIQMGSKEVIRNQVIMEESERTDGESIFVVMLIQLKDPAEFKDVGSVMMGLVEVSVTEAEESGFQVDGVHVAGIYTDLKERKKQRFRTQFCLEDENVLGRRREGRSGDNYLWSMSVKYYQGISSFRCWDCVRNPDVRID